MVKNFDQDHPHFPWSKYPFDHDHGENFECHLSVTMAIFDHKAITMAEIVKYSRSNSQDLDHDHCRNPNFLVVKMVNLKLDEIELKMFILTIDHEVNSRVSVAMVELFTIDHGFS